MVLPSKILGYISNVFVWLGTITLGILLIALPIYSRRSGRYNSAKDIFTSSYNQTEWSNMGLVFLLTFLTPCWCISGYDSTGEFNHAALPPPSSPLAHGCWRTVPAQRICPRRRTTHPRPCRAQW